MPVCERHQDPEAKTRVSTAQTVQSLFASRVAEAPNDPALRDAKIALSYAELDAWSDAVAADLQQHGIKPNDRVLIATPRSAHAICAMLAVIKAGAVYVPVDLNHPAQRLQYMAEDSGARAVLCCSDEVAIQELRAPHIRVRAPSRTPEPSAFIAPNRTADDMIYMIYTSGTTGRPKGVPILHRGVYGLLFGNDYYTAGPGDRFLQTASLAFDASVFEIWGALLNGAELILFEDPIPTAESLGAAIRQYGIDTLWLTPSLFGPIVAQDPLVFEGVSQLVLGGEPLSVNDVLRLYDAVPDLTVINGYGPSENSDFTCCYRVPRSIDPNLVRIPVGYAIGGDTLLLLDDAGQLVAAGEIGTLHIQGNRLTPGYHNNPALTSTAFRAHPNKSDDSIFSTGDLARVLPDGTLDILGRRDHLVKINGVRVETEEIDAVLETHPGIRHAVTIPDGEGIVARRLVAFVVVENTCPSHGELRRYLARSLPRVYLPAVFHHLSAIPLTPNGKCDREVLRGMIKRLRFDMSAPPIEYTSNAVADVDQENDTIGDSIILGTDQMRDLIANTWQSILSVRPKDGRQTFFDLGGTSMHLLEVQSQLQKATGAKISLTLFFSHPSLDGLADAITDQLAQITPQPASQRIAL